VHKLKNEMQLKMFTSPNLSDTVCHVVYSIGMVNVVVLLTF